MTIGETARCRNQLREVGIFWVTLHRRVGGVSGVRSLHEHEKSAKDIAVKPILIIQGVEKVALAFS